jgi:hypothetical protein
VTFRAVGNRTHSRTSRIASGFVYVSTEPRLNRKIPAPVENLVYHKANALGIMYNPARWDSLMMGREQYSPLRILFALYGTSGTILWAYALLRTIRRTQNTQGINLVNRSAVAVYLISV